MRGLIGKTLAALATVGALFSGKRVDAPENHHKVPRKPRSYRLGDPWGGAVPTHRRSRQRTRAEGRRLAFDAITEQNPNLPRRNRREYAMTWTAGAVQ